MEKLNKPIGQAHYYFNAHKMKLNYKELVFITNYELHFTLVRYN